MKSNHKKKKEIARREGIRQARARKAAKPFTSRRIAAKIMSNSKGLRYPAINVEIGADGAERITRYGVVPLADLDCPLCAMHGEVSTLYLDSVEQGFKDAGVLIGHCHGCNTRDKIGVKSAAYWGITADDLDGAEVIPAP